ncbi:MAG: HPr family phosphocarrier protein, partial [Candidatus Omnitrophica bacterium]|nr:HPr family phosphocarrier protein [Candidatus Omnitrophota bacterium]
FSATSVFAAPSTQNHPSLDNRRLPQPSRLSIPKDLGNFQEFHPGTSPAIFLIQDAHEIPEAQRNIEKLIEYLSTEYGVRSVKLEGASSKLDSQIFQSFPNQKRLREVFEEYYDHGELTGGTGAAIFSRQSIVHSPQKEQEGLSRGLSTVDRGLVFEGMEDWPLYEAGLGFYQEAMGKEEELQKAVSSMQEALREEKKSAYPKSLLVIDEVLEAFHENHANLKDVLFLLSKIRKPEKGTQLQVLLEEMQEEGKSRPAIVIEVRKLAVEVRKQLKGKTDPEFQAKFQEFQTSQIPPQSFALYMKQKFSLSVSDRLLGMVKHEETLKQIEGTELFRELEAYIKTIKESLFENAGQRELDRQTHQLQLLTKLVKLELTREDWEEVKAVSSMQKAVSSFHFSAFQDHLAFYRNAESREKAFSLLLSADGLLPTVIVAGGFHTQGLAQKLKTQGISYAIITPKMTTIPEQTNYREHMKGNVSWKNYFEVKDGKVNLYEAFVRATRDQLLKLDVRSSKLEEKDGDQLVQLPTSNFQLAKLWRDQIIRDLAAKNELTKAHEYTRFIDELSIEQSVDLPAEAKRQAGSKGFENSMPYALSPMLRQAEKFVEGLKFLHSQNQLTDQNILNLLKPSTTPSLTVNAGGLDPRSELRSSLFDFLLGDDSGLRRKSRIRISSAAPSILFLTGEPKLTTAIVLLLYNFGCRIKFMDDKNQAAFHLAQKKITFDLVLVDPAGEGDKRAEWIHEQQAKYPDLPFVLYETGSQPALSNQDGPEAPFPEDLSAFKKSIASQLLHSSLSKVNSLLNHAHPGLEELIKQEPSFYGDAVDIVTALNFYAAKEKYQEIFKYLADKLEVWNSQRETHLSRLLNIIEISALILSSQQPASGEPASALLPPVLPPTPPSARSEVRDVPPSAPATPYDDKVFKGYAPNMGVTSGNVVFWEPQQRVMNQLFIRDEDKIVQGRVDMKVTNEIRALEVIWGKVQKGLPHDKGISASDMDTVDHWVNEAKAKIPQTFTKSEWLLKGHLENQNDVPAGVRTILNQYLIPALVGREGILYLNTLELTQFSHDTEHIVDREAELLMIKIFDLLLNLPHGFNVGAEEKGNTMVAMDQDLGNMRRERFDELIPKLLAAIRNKGKKAQSGKSAVKAVIDFLKKEIHNRETMRQENQREMLRVLEELLETPQDVDSRAKMQTLRDEEQILIQKDAGFEKIIEIDIENISYLETFLEGYDAYDYVFEPEDAQEQRDQKITEESSRHREVTVKTLRRLQKESGSIKGLEDFEKIMMNEVSKGRRLDYAISKYYYHLYKKHGQILKIPNEEIDFLMNYYDIFRFGDNQTNETNHIVVVAREIRHEVDYNNLQRNTRGRGKIVGIISPRQERETRLPHWFIFAKKAGIIAIPYVRDIAYDELSEMKYLRAIVDGKTGEVIFNPSEHTLRERTAKEERYKALDEYRLSRAKDPVMVDGEAFGYMYDETKLERFVDEPSGPSMAVSHGGDALGLFRIEEIIVAELERRGIELDRWRLTLAVAKIMSHGFFRNGTPFVARLFDVAKDKRPRFLTDGDWDVDSVIRTMSGSRFYLNTESNHEDFRSFGKRQLKSLFAAHLRKYKFNSGLRILFSDVQSADEIRKIEKLFDEAKRDFLRKIRRDEKLRNFIGMADKDEISKAIDVIPLGYMFEDVRAVENEREKMLQAMNEMNADRRKNKRPEAMRFLGIGSNDLSKSILEHRTPKLSSIQVLNPYLIRSIVQIAESAKKNNIDEVALEGEWGNSRRMQLVLHVLRQHLGLKIKPVAATDQVPELKEFARNVGEIPREFSDLVLRCVQGDNMPSAEELNESALKVQKTVEDRIEQSESFQTFLRERTTRINTESQAGNLAVKKMAVIKPVQVVVIQEGDGYHSSAFIVDPIGLHARPSAILVKIALNSSAEEVWVHYDGEDLNLKEPGVGIMDLIMLAAGPGAELKFSATGTGAEEAVREMATFIATPPPSDSDEHSELRSEIRSELRSKSFAATRQEANGEIILESDMADLVRELKQRLEKYSDAELLWIAQFKTQGKQAEKTKERTFASWIGQLILESEAKIKGHIESSIFIPAALSGETAPYWVIHYIPIKNHTHRLAVVNLKTGKVIKRGILFRKDEKIKIKISEPDSGTLRINIQYKNYRPVSSSFSSARSEVREYLSAKERRISEFDRLLNERTGWIHSQGGLRYGFDDKDIRLEGLGRLKDLEDLQKVSYLAFRRHPVSAELEQGKTPLASKAFEKTARFLRRKNMVNQEEAHVLNEAHNFFTKVHDIHQMLSPGTTPMITSYDMTAFIKTWGKEPEVKRKLALVTQILSALSQKGQEGMKLKELYGSETEKKQFSTVEIDSVLYWLHRVGFLRQKDETFLLPAYIKKIVGDSEAFFNFKQDLVKLNFYFEYYSRARAVYGIVQAALRKMVPALEAPSLSEIPLESSDVVIREEGYKKFKYAGQRVIALKLGANLEDVLKHPKNIAQIFYFSVQNNLPVSDELLLEIRRRAKGWVPDEAARKIFLEISSQKNAGFAYRQMHLAEILGSFVPSLRNLETQFPVDTHSPHRYSLAAHTLETVDVIGEILTASPESSLAFLNGAIDAVAGSSSPEKKDEMILALNLGALYHDSAKGVFTENGDEAAHPLVGAETIVPRELKNYSLPRSVQEWVSWFVRFHQEINNIVRALASSDNALYALAHPLIDDAGFSPETLALLCALSVADRYSIDPSYSSYNESARRQIEDRGTYLRDLDKIHQLLLPLASKVVKDENLARLKKALKALKSNQDKANKELMTELKSKFKLALDPNQPEAKLVKHALKDYMDSMDGTNHSVSGYELSPATRAYWFPEGISERIREGLQKDFERMFKMAMELYPVEVLHSKHGIIKKYEELLNRMIFLKHLELLEAGERPSVLVQVTHESRGSIPYLRVTVGVSKDEMGISARINAALAGNGFNIAQAEIQTNQQGLVIDHMVGNVEEGKMPPGGLDEFETTVREDILALIRVRKDIKSIFGKNPANASFKIRGKYIKTKIKFSRTQSASYSKMNMTTSDRLGLQFAVSYLLTFGFKINVQHGPIGTDSEGAKDAYYLNAFNGSGKPVKLTLAQQSIMEKFFEHLLDKQVITFQELELSALALSLSSSTNRSEVRLVTQMAEEAGKAFVGWVQGNGGEFNTAVFAQRYGDDPSQFKNAFLRSVKAQVSELDLEGDIEAKTFAFTQTVLALAHKSQSGYSDQGVTIGIEPNSSVTAEEQANAAKAAGVTQILFSGKPDTGLQKAFEQVGIRYLPAGNLEVWADPNGVIPFVLSGEQSSLNRLDSILSLGVDKVSGSVGQRAAVNAVLYLMAAQAARIFSKDDLMFLKQIASRPGELSPVEQLKVSHLKASLLGPLTVLGLDPSSLTLSGQGFRLSFEALERVIASYRSEARIAQAA